VNKKIVFQVAAGLALVAAGAMGTASADPTSTPRLLNGIGSDTTAEVMNGISKLAAGSNIASWDAVGSTTFDTGNSGCTSVARANGSSAGRTQLIADSAGCTQFARSSSFSANENLTYYPFAVDGLDFAVTQNSSIPKTLTKAELVSIYSCGVSGYVPVLPQVGSGTRGDWLKYLFSGSDAFPPTGVTDTSCYLGLGTTGLPEEHDGRSLTSTQIAPYSSAKWVSQMTATVSDKRGKSVLGIITDGAVSQSPVVTNSNFSSVRTVNNVIRRADATAIAATFGTDNIANTTDDAVAEGSLTPTQIALKRAFVGPNSIVCANAGTLTNYGFMPIPSGASYACGAPRIS